MINLRSHLGRPHNFISFRPPAIGNQFLDRISSSQNKPRTAGHLLNIIHNNFVLSLCHGFQELIPLGIRLNPHIIGIAGGHHNNRGFSLLLVCHFEFPGLHRLAVSGDKLPAILIDTVFSIKTVNLAFRNGKISGLVICRTLSFCLAIQFIDSFHVINHIGCFRRDDGRCGPLASADNMT